MVSWCSEPAMRGSQATETVLRHLDAPHIHCWKSKCLCGNALGSLSKKAKALIKMSFKDVYLENLLTMELKEVHSWV